MTQIQKASSTSSMFFRISLLLLCLCLCLGISKVSCIDTLKQGENLNSSSQLDSPNGLFTLRFYSPQRSNATYIAILLGQSANLSSDSSPVWIGNRDEPIPNNSTPSLTLGARGELNITRRDGGDPIQLFAGASQPTNVTATLSDAGNFVIRSSIGNNNQTLWQSFDHPTDTLLSEMKLGVNNISSWLSPINPASGAFTLDWEPTSGELVIRRRGVPYWRSGQLMDYYDEDLGNVKSFENFLFDPDPFNFNYNLTSEGEYFMFSVIPVAGKTPENRKVNSGWRLSSTGNIATIDDRGINMAMASLCYGYNSGGSSNSRGCQLWEQPKRVFG